ncbi:docking protein 1 L homeolog isoform X1 [Xenopus laevis]|uniref:Docking protein 1 L homeolog isoform X1 n=1 Tax=Xenopus laevis TaxID=8355 RepID=A0A8J1M3W4_XENLA|nr:docking protein 1 L homeolog isoform X1 [Xenopus laevis]
MRTHGRLLICACKSTTLFSGPYSSIPTSLQSCLMNTNRMGIRMIGDSAKKWKRCHALLYPDSPFGVARLEFYDWKEGPVVGEKGHTRRATDRKVVRLAECICVAPSASESGPKDNMMAFTLETNDKTILLSSDRVGASEWVQKLCELAFPTKSSSQDKEPTDPPVSSSLEMSINSLYVSREDVSEFWVTVQRTEAAERCSLHGSYVLKTESDCLLLKDPNTKETLYSWPYKLLRRYGRDKVMFSFESGRRCSSGAGNFTFETSLGHEIFQRVESSIRAQQGSDNRLSCPNLETDCAIDVSSEFSIPEAQNKSGPVRKDPEEKPLKGRILPNLPGPKSVAPQLLLDHSCLGAKSGSSHTPPRSPVSSSASRHLEVDHEQLVGVYSEPKDSVKVIKPQFDPLYSDPVDCVAGKVLKGERSKLDPSERSPLYSDLYEHVGYESVGAAVSPKCQKRPTVPHAGEEHIYDEPEGMAQAPQVYSEVCMEGGAWKRQATDDKLGYEYPYNPNTDDYSVPNFQGQRGQARSRGLGPKPVPAPKPQGIVIARTLTGKEGGEGDNACGYTNNNNNNSNSDAIYSQVHKKEAAKCSPNSSPATQGTCHPQPVPSRPLNAPSVSPSAKSVLLAPHSTKPLAARPVLPKNHSAGKAPPLEKPQTVPLQPSSAPPALASPADLANENAIPSSVISQSALAKGKELSAHGARISSIYEDMGVL